MTQADSYIVTIDDTTPDGFRILERDILKNFSYKSKNKSKQITGNEINWEEYITPKYDLKIISDILEKNTWHKKACNTVSKDSTSRKWTIIPRADLPHEPDPRQKEQAKEFIHQLTTPIQKIHQKRIFDKWSVGCAAIEKIRDHEGKVVDLKHMNVTTLRLHRNGKIIIQCIGTKHVYFKVDGADCDVDYKTGEIYPLGTLPYERKATEVIWTNEYATNHDDYGLANIIPAIDAILGDIGREQYNTKFFENYGLPAFAVTVTGDFEDYNVPKFLSDGTRNQAYDEKKTLKYAISQQIKEVIRNPHSAVTITVPTVSAESNVDVKIQPLSVDMKEASFRLYRQDNREEVAAANGVPLDRLGIAVTGQLGGSIAETLGDVYADSTIPENRDDNCQLINDCLLENGIYDYVFSLPNFRKKDKKEELEQGTIVFEHGGMTVGEYITYFGKQFGAQVPENMPLLDYRVINGQLYDDYGNCISSQMSGMNDTFLDNLESQLLRDSENIARGEDNDKNTDGNTSTKFQNNPDGVEGSSNTKIAEHIKSTIQRAFDTRRSNER